MFSLCRVGAATFDVGTIAGWSAIRISGPIVVGDDATFENLAFAKKRLIVELNSPGGAVFPALAIGRFIHDRDNWTLVGNNESCASACAMIWLAGTKRFAHPRGSVGFHAVFDGVTKEITGNGNAVVGAYYDYLGLTQDAIFWMASASPNGMFWLNHDLANKYKIDFIVSNDADQIIVTQPAAASSGIPTNPDAPSVAFIPPTSLAPPSSPPNQSPPMQQQHQPQAVVLNPMQRAASLRLARQFEKRLAEAGADGLTGSIQACYAAVRRSYDASAGEYCAALDEMAWKLDSKNAQDTGVQTTLFNREENVRARINDAASALGYSPDTMLDDATEIAKRAQEIVDAEGPRVALVAAQPPVVRRRPRVVRPRYVAGCTPFNPLAALLVGATLNPACR